MSYEVSRPEFITLNAGEFPSPDRYDRCELKVDGWFSHLVIENNRWELYSRTSRLLREGPLPDDEGYVLQTVLSGEFCYGTQWAKRHEKLYGSLIVFGADCIGGLDTRHESNAAIRRQLELIIPPLARHLREYIPNIQLIEQFEASRAKELWDQYVLGPEDYEGMIFLHSEYHERSLARMKRAVSMDYVCMGFEDSDSDTYAGWGVASILGGLYIDGSLVQVCRVPGITDELRAEFFNNREKYVGRVFEAHGKRVFKSGALRHPEFIRWRDDKLPKDCVLR